MSMQPERSKEAIFPPKDPQAPWVGRNYKIERNYNNAGEIALPWKQKQLWAKIHSKPVTTDLPCFSFFLTNGSLPMTRL